MKGDILSRILAWAETEDAIRAMILIGSRAQDTVPDPLADYDISIFTTDVETYANNRQWIPSFGGVWVAVDALLYRNKKAFPTRLVIYEGGVKVDFSLFSMEILETLTKADPLPDDYLAGYKVLLDKDARTKNMLPSVKGSFTGSKPGQETFIKLIEEFWFEAYHVAKYLKRGDLWSAKFRDGLIKAGALVTMLQWHAQARNNWEFSPHPNGKQMEEWLETETWQDVRFLFAPLEISDSLQALTKMMALFRKLALETANNLGYHYPQNVDDNISSFIESLAILGTPSPDPCQGN